MTGGASGLGKATAGRFASKGARVVLCDLDTSNGSEVAADIGNDTLYIPADVRSENDVKSLLAEIKKKFGRLDAIVNCAGISIAFDTYNFKSERAHRLEDFQKVLMVCLSNHNFKLKFLFDRYQLNLLIAFTYRQILVVHSM